MRFIRFILSGIVLLLFGVTTVFGAEMNTPHRTDIDFSINSRLPVDDLYEGDEVYIIYSLSESLPVYAAEITFDYDRDKLELKKTESFSSEGEIVEYSNQSDGNEVYMYSLLGLKNVQKVTDVIKITFTAKKTGSAYVSMQSAKIILEEDDNISFKIFDSEIKQDVNIKSVKTEPVVTPPIQIGGGHRGGGGGGIVISKDTNIKSETKKPDDENVQKPSDNPPAVNIREDKFSDITSVLWAEDAINNLVKKEIISGYPDGTYKPNKAITRAEIAKIITSAFKLENTSDKLIGFTDISLDDWYYPYVTTAYHHGIINGESKEICAPERNVSREEFAAMLDRTISVKGIAFADARLYIPFDDEKDISEFAVLHVQKLYSMGILNGTDGNLFNPQGDLTRAETAVAINNILINVNNSELSDEDDKDE